MEMKDYSLTCGEVTDNLLTLADAYEKASAGKAPNGFAFNPTDAAANMKAAVAFIGIFGQQMPRWIPVEEGLPEIGVLVMAGHTRDGWVGVGQRVITGAYLHWEDGDGEDIHEPTHWMPLPHPPEEAT